MTTHPRLAALAASALLLCACGSTAGAVGQASPTPRPSASLPAQVKAVIATEHGPATFAVDDRYLYVADHRGGTIQRIDPGTNRIVTTGQVGGQVNLGDPGPQLWACTNSDSAVHRVDPTTLDAASSTAADCDGGSVSVIGSTVWSVPGGDGSDGQRILVFDAATGRQLASVPFPSGANGGPAVALADGRIAVGGGPKAPTFTAAGKPAGTLGVDLGWLVYPVAGHLYRVPDDGRIIELDPRTLATVRTIQAPAHFDDWNWALTGDGKGHLWYRPDYTHLYTVDLATGSVSLLMTLPWEEAPTAIRYAFGSLWVTNFDADTVWRVDPTV